METYTAACTDILAALNEPENADRLARARELSGTDMVKVMREVFPIVTQIQLEVGH